MFFSIAMDADYLFYVKNIETHARAFLPLNISAIGTVLQDSPIQEMARNQGSTSPNSSHTFAVQFHVSRY